MATRSRTTAGSPSATSSLTSGCAEALRQPAFFAFVRAHLFLAGVVIVCSVLIGAVGSLVVYPQLAGLYHWRKAQQALAQYDFLPARGHLQRCREAWPASADTCFLLARTCRRGGDVEAAQTYLREAERLGEVPALIELERLLLMARAGVVQAFEEELGRFLETRPDERPIILEALVLGSLQGNFLEDAYRWSTRWVTDTPDDGRSHLLRGQVLERGLRYDLAAEAYQRALECNPDSLAAHLGIGEMFIRTGKYAEALPHFQVCVQKEPQHTIALLGMARCQRYLGPPEAAWATLERLFNTSEPDPGAVLLRGQLELERGNAQEALTWLKHAERLQPSDLETIQALANALRLLDRKDEAQTYEEKRHQTERDLRQIGRAHV